MRKKIIIEGKLLIRKNQIFIANVFHDFSLNFHRDGKKLNKFLSSTRKLNYYNIAERRSVLQIRRFGGLDGVDI
jgi:hypothetical protein